MNYRPLGTVLRLVGIACLTACDSVAPVADPIAFSFRDSAATTVVVVSIHNTSDDVVFLPRCGEHVLPELERQNGNEWVNAAAGICPAILRMDPIPLAIGAVHHDSVSVMGPGTYRLRLAVLRGNTVAPPEPVVSQSFSVD